MRIKASLLQGVSSSRELNIYYFKMTQCREERQTELCVCRTVGVASGGDVPLAAVCRDWVKATAEITKKGLRGKAVSCWLLTLNSVVKLRPVQTSEPFLNSAQTRGKQHRPMSQYNRERKSTACLWAGAFGQQLCSPELLQGFR